MRRIAALRDLDWGGKAISLRINGLDTHYPYRDMVDVIEQGGERLDLIMVPMVGTAAAVYAVDMLATQLETAVGRRQRVGFELIIESALGMANVDAIAGASPRNESLHFGVADYAASTGARTTRIGAASPDHGVLCDADAEGERAYHQGDVWHYALARIVVAARANGLRPVDGPFGDIDDGDGDGYRAQAKRAAALGCDGKWAIHPSQIATANDVFAPSQDDLNQANSIVAAMEEARQHGRGAVALDGRMIDNASVRQAQNLLRKSEQIGARDSER